MNYRLGKSVISKKERREMVDNPIYFHNYLFPHNEKRTYRNKLTLVGDNVVYLGITLKDKTDRHWKVEKPIIVSEKQSIVNANISLNKKQPLWLYVVNGENRYYYVEKKLTDFDLVGKDVIYKGIKFGIVPPKTKVRGFEKYRIQFDALPLSDKQCCYCEVQLDRNSTTRDHILPISRGGKGVDYGHPNIKPCCVDCNAEKGNLLLHSYIQLLNYKLADTLVNSPEHINLQTKIRNANSIAKSLCSPTPPPK